MGNLLRLLKIVARLVVLLLSPRSPDDVLRFFASLGGCWTKLGQALALRYDLLPPAYCDALFRLFDSNPAEPLSQMLRDVPQAARAALVDLEPTALASGSIAQVHRASLSDGTSVVVKIRHRKAVRRFRQDLSIMRRLLRNAAFFGRQRVRSFEIFFEEFEDWTLRELDLRNEVSNARLLSFNAEGSEQEAYPQIYASLCAENFVVMDFVAGPTLASAIGRNGNSTVVANRCEIAGKILLNSLNQIYVFGVFHADLHPANIIIGEGGRIYYVDFGITGYITDDVRESVMLYSASLFLGDVDGAVGEILSWIDPRSPGRPEDAKAELSRMLRQYLLTFELGGEGVTGATPQTLDVELLSVLQHHRLVFRPEFSVYMKAITTLNGVLFDLVPDFPLQDRISRFFRRYFESDILGEVLDPPSALFAMRQVRRFRRLGETLDQLTTAGSEAGYRLKELTDGLYSRIVIPMAVLGAALLVLATWGPNLLRINVSLGFTNLRLSTLFYFGMGVAMIMLALAVLRVRRIRDLPDRQPGRELRISARPPRI